MTTKMICLLMSLICLINPTVHGSEVLEETKTQVVVREHPKTGKPYVSIAGLNVSGSQNLLGGRNTKISRPDYRLLDPKVKSGEIPYEGPYTSPKRIYIFAATLATIGVAGGVVGMAAAPAAASAGGAASGGGVFLAGGSAVTAGSAGTLVAASQRNSNQDNFVQTSQSHSDKEEKKKETAYEI